MLWYFLYQAFQVNNLNFIKSWRRITDFMAINLTWEFLLSHSSIFMKVQTKTFPRGSKSTLEISWDNFSEAQDKGQGHGQSYLHVQGQVFCQGNTGFGVSWPWWKSGFWSSPAVPLGQVARCLCAWVASKAEILIYVQWSGRKWIGKYFVNQGVLLKHHFIKLCSLRPFLLQEAKESSPLPLKPKRMDICQAGLHL